MVRFHIKVLVNEFYWQCYSQNNRFLFENTNVTTKKLRNCINHIQTITKHMKKGTYCIVLDKNADELRKELNEPLYGIKNGVVI